MAGKHIGTKLTDLLDESFLDSDEQPPEEEQEKQALTREQKKQILTMVAEYNKFGKVFETEHSLSEIAQTLSEICEGAHQFVLDEADDWFDQVTINRNMKDLQKLSEEFGKSATEGQAVQQRLHALYEDMGVILNRYFEIADQASTDPTIHESNLTDAAVPVREGEYGGKKKKKKRFESTLTEKTLSNEDKEEIRREFIDAASRFRVKAKTFANLVRFVGNFDDVHKATRKAFNELGMAYSFTEQGDPSNKYVRIFDISKPERLGKWQSHLSIESINERGKWVKSRFDKEDEERCPECGNTNGEHLTSCSRYPGRHDRIGNRTKKYENIQEIKVGNYDIGMGHKGNGLTVWDRNREENGDYVTIAHIDDRGKLTIHDKSAPSAVKKFLQKLAADTKRGDVATEAVVERFLTEKDWAQKNLGYSRSEADLAATLPEVPSHRTLKILDGPHKGESIPKGTSTWTEKDPRTGKWCEYRMNKAKTGFTLFYCG